MYLFVVNLNGEYEQYKLEDVDYLQEDRNNIYFEFLSHYNTSLEVNNLLIYRWGHLIFTSQRLSDSLIPRNAVSFKLNLNEV